LFFQAGVLNDMEYKRKELSVLLDSLRRSDFDLNEHFIGLFNYQDTLFSINPVPSYRIPLSVMQNYSPNKQRNIKEYLISENKHIACILNPSSTKFHSNIVYLTKTRNNWDWSSGGGEISGKGSLNQAYKIAFSYSDDIFLIVYSHPEASTLLYKYGIGYIKDGRIGVVQPTNWDNPPLEFDDINEWFREWKPYEMYQKNK
jgi:hypothetical protein